MIISISRENISLHPRMLFQEDVLQEGASGGSVLGIFLEALPDEHLEVS